MHRLAMFLALGVALLAGCGGGSDEDGSDASPPAGTKTPTEVSDAGEKSKEAPSGGRKKTDARDKTRSPKQSPKKGSESSPTTRENFDERFADSVADAPPEAIAKLIRAGVLSSIAIYNLKLADLQITDRGRSVNVLITRGSACNAIAKEEFAMGERVRATAPVVKTIRFGVAGTSRALGDYVLGCKEQRIPSGPGVTVFDRTAVGGPVTTKSFTIKGKRWAIEWKNTANTLAVIVLPSNDKYYAPIGSQKKETGRKLYRRPGKYRLKIYGSALWTVRVKDIR